jgi:hydrogenase maturation protease
VIRIIGVGNPHRGDDAAGLAAARILREAGPDRVRIDECEDDPMRLLERWEEDDSVIVVDAASSGDVPGTIRRFDAIAGPLPARHFAISSHGVGVVGAIELARALGRLPRTLVVYAIEGSDFSTGRGMSPAVEGALRGLVALILAEVEQCGEAPEA